MIGSARTFTERTLHHRSLDECERRDNITPRVFALILRATMNPLRLIHKPVLTFRSPRGWRVHSMSRRSPISLRLTAVLVVVTAGCMRIAPGSLDTTLSYAAWRSSYSSRASIGVLYPSFSRRQVVL